VSQEREMEEIRAHERRLEMQKNIVEEERQRLLRQHAPNLLGFLPKVIQPHVYSPPVNSPPLTL